MDINQSKLHLVILIILWSIPQMLFAFNYPAEKINFLSTKGTPQDSINKFLSQISLVNSSQRTKITKDLRQFNYSNFTAEHKENIALFLNDKELLSNELVLLSGFLNMETTLLSLLEKHRNDKAILQYINIALVRAGNVSKTKTLLKNLEKLSVNDPFVYEVVPLLTYTKAPIIFDWLLDQIMSDEENCHPADAEGSGNINCAYRIIEAVAPNIIDFPVKLDQWGDLDVKSYSQALTTIRNWITTNKSDYTLDKQTY